MKFCDTEVRGGIGRVHLCLWTYSAIGLICLLLVRDVCNIAIAIGRGAILTNTHGLQSSLCQMTDMT